MIQHACDPALYCRLCELAGRPTPPPDHRDRACIPTPPPGPCEYRGDDVPAGEIAAAGFNPARQHFRCGHPTTPLGIVSGCGGCGDKVKAPYCGSGCAGHQHGTAGRDGAILT